MVGMLSQGEVKARRERLTSQEYSQEELDN